MKVELIAYTPNPDGVVNLAAQTCVSEGIPDIETSSNGKKAMRRALDSGHESILDHVSFTFTVEGISRVCSHQLVRQRIGVGISQQSQRYVKLEPLEILTPDTVLKAAEKDKPENPNWRPIGNLDDCLGWYTGIVTTLVKRMRELGVPEEDIRYFYPQGTQTNVTFTLSGTALKHFLGRRLCTRAQWEIRKVAEAMFEEVKKVAPIMSEYLGPQCEQLGGACPEERSCGMYGKLSRIIDIADEVDEQNSIEWEQKVAEWECH